MLRHDAHAPRGVIDMLTKPHVHARMTCARGMTAMNTHRYAQKSRVHLRVRSDAPFLCSNFAEHRSAGRVRSDRWNQAFGDIALT